MMPQNPNLEDSPRPCPGLWWKRLDSPKGGGGAGGGVGGGVGGGPKKYVRNNVGPGKGFGLKEGRRGGRPSWSSPSHPYLPGGGHERERNKGGPKNSGKNDLDRPPTIFALFPPYLARLASFFFLFLDPDAPLPLVPLPFAPFSPGKERSRRRRREKGVGGVLPVWVALRQTNRSGDF